MKYAYLGSPNFSKLILEYLLRKYSPPSLVITQSAKGVGRGRKTHRTSVAELALSRELPLLETEDVNAPQPLEKLASLGLDAIVVVAFGQLLGEKLLAIPRRLSINLHGSLLPRYRGAAPVQWAIWNGDATTGVTVQKMVKRLDAGDIICQEKIAIGPDDLTRDLLNKMVEPGGRLLVETLQNMESSRVILTPQNETVATYAKKMDRSHSKIDWNRNASDIRNQVRATLPWPATHVRLGGKSVKILKAIALDGAGAIESIDCDGKKILAVQCGVGRLGLMTVQPENKRPMEIAEYLRGFHDAFPFTKVD